LWFGRSAAEAELAHGLEQRLRPAAVEVDAEPAAEVEEIAQRERPLRGDSGTVERARSVDEHPPVRHLGKELVDRLVEPQAAFLDDHQRSDRRHGLRHGRDAKQGVALDLSVLAVRQGAGGAHLHFAVTRGEPRGAADAPPLDMAQQ